MWREVVLCQVERRTVNSWLLAVILILLIVASTVAEDVAREKVQPATGGPVVRGGVVILKEAMTKSVSINVGGLVVVQIPDSQSHPPQGITVKASSGDARSLGHVRGCDRPITARRFLVVAIPGICFVLCDKQTAFKSMSATYPT